MVMAIGKYPWIAEAILEWEMNICSHKGEKLYCDECMLDGKICGMIVDLAKTIEDKIKEEEEED